MNTYRHIKAEHEAGHRSKSKLEKALDEMRKRKTGTQVIIEKQTSSRKREREKIRKSEPERVRWAEQYLGKTRGDEWKPSAAETEAWERHRREEEERRRRKEDNGRRKKDADQRNIQNSPVPEIRLQPPVSTRTRRRQMAPVARDLSHLPPLNNPPPAVSEPLGWQHALPIREEEAHKHEIPPPREPSIQGLDDRPETGAAASYYDHAPRSPMPGGYKENAEAEHGRHDQPEAYDEVSRPDIPPSPGIPPYPETPPSPVRSEGSSGSPSPIMSHAPQAVPTPPQFTSEFLQSIPMPTPQQSVPAIPPPATLPPPPGPAPPLHRLPPPPPLPAARPANDTVIAALLGDIKGGKSNLRKVAESERRDSSNNPRAGRVVYEEMAHSHDVEEHERAQAREASNQSPFRGNSAWSTPMSMDEEDDVQPASNKAFQEDLAKALQARGSDSGTDIPATGSRRGSDDSPLTADSRTSMIANASRKTEEKAPLQ
ncbi:hypothetical protein G6011_07792 [Alternaria panax]|uniref:WH2 domain-containing protein n=1 Tax=Alternaria panax TaxID=48097 RepID=A0AAD4I4A9_9PLEO|nr:hypothetical protein G6011_07792 [Alternaria panax]